MFWTRQISKSRCGPSTYFTARFTEMSPGLNIQCTNEGTVDYLLQVVFKIGTI